MKVLLASLVALFAAVPAFAGYYAAPVRVVRPVVVVRPAVVSAPVYRASSGCCHWKRVVLPCGTVKFVRVCY